MPSPSDQRALATALAEVGDAELAALIASRGIPATVSWRDLFDAAEAMLEPAAVARGLAGLRHAHAAALDAAVRADAPVASTALSGLQAAAVVGPDGRPFGAVAVAVADREPVPPVPVASHDEASEAETAAAAERAFAHTAALADVLLQTIDSPLGRIGSGGLGATERRNLVESGAAPDADTADLLVGLAEVVGLLSGSERTWTATPAAREWVTASTVQRWSDVATRLRSALPSALRSDDGGWIPSSSWVLAYPYDTGWPARAALWRIRAVAWGLLTPSGAVTPWAAALAAGDDADAASVERMLPPEVDRVFLQNDLTAIAPGPLAPALDVRLRTMAHRESRAQASTYRFDAGTVAAAITAGETAESLRSFLSDLSLTGLPQPLDYMIEHTAARHGLVRVGADGDAGRARVTSEDAALIETIAVDQALRPLGLVRDGDALVSRAGVDAVFWGLADARYPVVAVGGDGAPRRIERATATVRSRRSEAAEGYAALVARLRSGGGGADGDAAWLERELDQAVKARAIVDVVVELPDGKTRTFRLEATGLGGGRLRGRDRGADVERTLPVTSIRSVHPVE